MCMLVKSATTRPGGSARQQPETDDTEKFARIAWLAIRCAAFLAQTVRARNIPAGDAALISERIADAGHTPMPDFFALDLVAQYVLGHQKRSFER